MSFRYQEFLFSTCCHKSGRRGKTFQTTTPCKKGADSPELGPCWKGRKQQCWRERVLRMKCRRNYLMYIYKKVGKKFTFSGTVYGRNRKSCAAFCSRDKLQGTCDSLWYGSCFHVNFILTDAHRQKHERGSIPEAIFFNVSSHKSLQRKAEWMEKASRLFQYKLSLKAFSRKNHIIKQTVSSHWNLETGGKLGRKLR